MRGKCWISVLLIIIMAGWGPRATPVHAQTSGIFPQTGFAIDDPRFQDFFEKRGGLQTFGYPVSRTFTLLGFPVQIFQRAIMQRAPDGHVQLLNLFDSGLFPYSQVNGATFPEIDQDLLRGAPPVGSPDRQAAVLSWIAEVAPDRWNGLPVGFHQHFLGTVSPRVAFPSGPGNPALLAGFDLEIWGLPTSQPAFDPRNHNVVYQRFQRGILQYDAGCGCTQGVLLADYFKNILRGQDLPTDLSQAAAHSRFFAQYNPAKPDWVDRPELLPATDLREAFEPEAVPSSNLADPLAPIRIGIAPPPNVSATSIAVVDVASGELLYGRDPHRRLAPASLTKIFTALVALRQGHLDQQITVQFDPTMLTDSTLMGIRPGEVYSLEDLLYGLMLPSGNDAALAIANGIAGSEPRFVALMNAQVRDLALTDTHLVNPHGLDAPDHYASAYDLAIATRYGLNRFPTFRQLAATRRWTVRGTRSFAVSNLNRFLVSYPGADGVKIGYTEAAGHTIVASATRNGHQVIVAVLNCRDIVADTVPLFDWVFASFRWPSR